MSGETPVRILPERTAASEPFWTGGVDGRLHLQYCEACAEWIFPAEPDCPACDGALSAKPVSGDGTVFTYTINQHPFNPAVPLPYVIAIVELDDQAGLRIPANIVDCQPDSVAIGMPVQVRFERQETEQGTVFVPVFAPGG